MHVPNACLREIVINIIIIKREKAKDRGKGRGEVISTYPAFAACHQQGPLLIFCRQNMSAWTSQRRGTGGERERGRSTCPCVCVCADAQRNTPDDADPCAAEDPGARACLSTTRAHASGPPLRRDAFARRISRVRARAATFPRWPPPRTLHMYPSQGAALGNALPWETPAPRDTPRAGTPSPGTSQGTP